MIMLRTTTPAQEATTVVIRKTRNRDAVDDLMDSSLPSYRSAPIGRRLRSLDTAAPLKRAIRQALLSLGYGGSRELVAKALHKALTDHEAKHPSP